MTRFADPHRCPDCRAPLAPGSQDCGRCGLDLSGELGQRLFVTLSTADDLLDRLRARSTRPEESRLVATAGAGARSGGPGTPGSGPGVGPTGPAGPTGPTGPAMQPPVLPEPAGVRPSSVPKILLSLGATCLLVAALVFLAVTWSVMGVGGRTATLVGLTVVMGALSAVSARHALRGAVEAMGLVTTGLVVLDAVGARSAGWLGEPTDAGFVTALGVLLLAGGLAATAALVRTPVRGFTVGEIAAVVGSVLVLWGLNAGAWANADVRALVGTVVVGAIAAGLWTRVGSGPAFQVAAIGTSTVAAGSWLVQSALALEHAAADPTVAALWGRLDVWPLLAATAVGVAVAAVRVVPAPVRVLTLGVSVVLAAITVTLPSYDETATVTTLTLVGAVLVVAVGIAVAPRPWNLAGFGALALGSVALLVPVFAIVAGSIQVYGDTAGLAWAGTPDVDVVPVRVGTDVGDAWLLPLCVAAITAAILAAAREALRLVDDVRDVPARHLLTAAGGLLALSGAATVMHYPVPVWTVLAGLLVLVGTALGIGLARPSRSMTGLAGALVAVALPLSFADEHLTAGTLAVALVLTGAALALSRDEAVEDVAAGLLPFVLGGLVWSAGAALEIEGSWRALVGLLVLGGLMLGRSALDRSAASSVVLVEVCCGLAALPLAVAGVASAPLSQGSSWTAVYLTVAGTFASILALVRSDRRQVGWLGGFLLAAATWVRLEDLGVREPEAYTLPSALALVVVGLVHLRSRPGSSTQVALGPGLALALVPSLLWVLTDPFSMRAVLLGLACLALVVAGVQARWSAPLVYGAVVGALVVVREAAPLVGDSVPRWALIGLAGMLLIGLGVTWEARMRDARRAAQYVRALR